MPLAFPFFFFLALFALFVVSFEADATEGLSYMHSLGIIHCDHKLENTLVCRSDCPTGFVGKVTDPGLWCGEFKFEGNQITPRSGNKNASLNPQIPINPATFGPLYPFTSVWGQVV